MQSLGSPSWKFLAKELPIILNEDSNVLCAMKYYYYWNLRAEKTTGIRVSAENFKSDITRVLKDRKINFNSVAISERDKVNTRKHSILTWDDLYKEDYELTEKIKELGKSYGY